MQFLYDFYYKMIGLLLGSRDLETMPEGNYNVVIDSKLSAGELHLIEAIIMVQIAEEKYFSSYLCHPSMANNELRTCPFESNSLIYKKMYPKSKYSYRFVLLPETIGSIVQVNA